MNSNKIRGRITELGRTQRDLAAEMGIKQATLSQKISGRRPITLVEAETLAGLLGISDNAFSDYFFAPKIAQRNESDQTA